MEQINQVVQQLKKLSGQSVSTFQLKECNNEISLYEGPLTGKVLFREIAKIQAAFSALPKEFYDILSSRLADNGFTDDRLKDAVNHVIDTCIYPTPTIAQFISWDKRIKVFKYPEIIKMVEDGDPNAFDRYKRIEFVGLPEAVWVHVNDCAKYNFKST
jgi:hypothetical protein